MAEVKVGNKAPDFKLPDADGNVVHLKTLRGKKVVLYFYPRDNTSGCTKEACEFRDYQTEFDKADTVILGVSPDSPKSHQNFSSKFELPFRLLADQERKVAELYGVIKEKKMYGKVKMGIERSTFVIDETGTLVREYRGVKVDGHVEEVLGQLAE